jgi:hypothetical protein
MKPKFYKFVEKCECHTYMVYLSSSDMLWHFKIQLQALQKLPSYLNRQPLDEPESNIQLQNTLAYLARK